MAETVAVLGAGSWGTALAIQLARNQLRVRLWGHEADHIARLRELRENSDFLPGFRLADNIEPVASLEDAVKDTPYLLIVIPSKGFRGLLQKLKPLIDDDRLLFWASKGFEIETGKLLHEVVTEELALRHYGVVSGPTFATEVARGMPAAIACAGNDPQSSETFAALLRGHHFRAYTSDDIVGVELGGALKNVLAIAVGVSDGLGFGANTRAALMTRGLSEIMHLGTALGAKRETLMGLAGLGDLILTCTDEGKNVTQAEIEVGQTVEGLRAAKAIYHKSKQLGLDLPIIDEVYHVLYDGKNPDDAVRDLESRPQGHE
jgi:glycerol-3-phosphate dehydrogenase (NAD(P)+)